MTGRRNVIPRALAGLLVVAASGGWAWAASGSEKLPPPPFEYKFWDGWTVEHLAFTLGQSGRPIGGPARWAVGGCLPNATTPVEQKELYTGGKDSEAILFLSDQRRRFWVLKQGEVWPIVGHDDVADRDGPGLYAAFKYSGVYSGGHSGMIAVGTTLYVVDNGCLRRISRMDDGGWTVATIAGLGKLSSIPPDGGLLADLSALGKGLALDPSGNLYFTMGGGLVKADPDGRVTWIIRRDRVRKDLEAVYAARWPGVEISPSFGLGWKESTGLVWHPTGIYGGGRTWPDAWKVAHDGVFVPIANYAPADKLIQGARWGKGDPAFFQVHCAMGFGVGADGIVWMENEQPSSRVRFLKDEVQVLAGDYTWKSLPWGSKDFLNYRDTVGISVNGAVTEAVGNAPGRAYSGRTVYLRARREK